MALTPNQLPHCCDPHHKYQKQLKLLLVKVLLVDFVLLLTGLFLFVYAKKYESHVDSSVARAIAFPLTVGGLVSFFTSIVLALVISISYHIHNAQDLHGKKKDSKGNKPTAKKSKK